MIEQELQQEINMTITAARNNCLEFVTVEHLLLALTKVNKVIDLLNNKNVNVIELRYKLEKYIDSHTPRIPQGSEIDIVPTIGFHRVLKRSLYQAKSAKMPTIYAMDVLESIFSEEDSHAAYLLNLNNISHLDVLNYISKQKLNSTIESPVFNQKLPTVDNIILDKNGRAYLQKSEPYTGNYMSKYKNNITKVAGQYVDGLKNGMWIKYYENGNKKSQVRYVNSKKEGMATYWNKDGIKTKEESYKNDLLDGKTTSFTWYQEGKLLDKIAIKS